MKTDNFLNQMKNATNSLMRITTDNAATLLKTNDDIIELRNFLKKETSFPNFEKIKNFIDWLDSYDDKIFDKWTDYVNVSFKRVGEFVYFDIDLNEDIAINKSYKQWYNQLTNKKPIIVYLIDDSVKADPERMEKLYKIIKKLQINKNTTSTKDVLSQELEDKLDDKPQDETENKLDNKLNTGSFDDVKQKFLSKNNTVSKFTTSFDDIKEKYNKNRKI